MRFKDITIVHTSIFYLQTVFLVAMHMLFSFCSKRDDEDGRALESLFLEDSYRKIQTNWGSDLVNPNAKKVY